MLGPTAATSYTVVSATSITAVSPPGTGTVDVTVTTPGGTSATSAADQFTYDPVPVVTGISPAAGPMTGGTTVTVARKQLHRCNVSQVRVHRRNRVSGGFAYLSYHKIHGRFSGHG